MLTGVLRSRAFASDVDLARMYLVRTLAAVMAVLAATVVSAAQPALAGMNRAHVATCSSMVLIGVRGSGEHAGFGHTIGALVGDIKAPQLDPAVEAEYVNDETSRFPWWKPSDYGVSYRNWVAMGVADLLKQVRASFSRCPGSGVYLAGYSQGAQVVADTYQSKLSVVEKARIGGVVLFGDPLFEGDQGGPIDLGSYSRRLNGIIVGATPVRLWSAADQSKVRSYCQRGDPVCDFASSSQAAHCGLESVCSHLHYADTDLPNTKTTYTMAAAIFLAGLWRAEIQAAGGGSGPDGPRDTPGGTTPTPTPTTGVSTPAPSSYSETSGSVVHTWTDYKDAGGSEGMVIPSNMTVRVKCRVEGFAVADGDTWWYLIASDPWNEAYYGSADAFYNDGQTSGSLIGTPFVDPTVPICAGGDGPPAEEVSAKTEEEAAARKKAEAEEKAGRTHAESSGSIVHTWTDYANAGGREGPNIASSETVQVECRVEGFRVEDGDTWWYLIASSPWSGTYYASADAFYNNGQTAGSLRGTPFVDLTVPEC
jgi:Cutinase